MREGKYKDKHNIHLICTYIYIYNIHIRHKEIKTDYIFKNKNTIVFIKIVCRNNYNQCIYCRYVIIYSTSWLANYDH